MDSEGLRELSDAELVIEMTYLAEGLDGTDTQAVVIEAARRLLQRVLAGR